MIDRSLNYGRHQIKRFMGILPKCDSILDIGAGHGTDLAMAREMGEGANCSAIETYRPYIRELRKQGVVGCPPNKLDTHLVVE